MAVRPPEEVRAELRRLDRLDDPRLRWVPEHQWHVTLRFWPEADPRRVSALLDDVLGPDRERAAPIAGAASDPVGMRRARAHLGPRVERLGPSAIVVPVSGLDVLAAAVHAATRDAVDATTRDEVHVDATARDGVDAMARDEVQVGDELTGGAVAASDRGAPRPDAEQVPPVHRFRGHLTLARFRGRPRRGAHAAILGAPVEAAFEVHEIELVESELGPTGAIHRVVGTWRLPG